MCQKDHLQTILFITKGDVQDGAGPLQPCAGQITGIEAAVHFMRDTFQLGDTKALLLVDATGVVMPSTPLTGRQCCTTSGTFVPHWQQF